MTIKAKVPAWLTGATIAAVATVIFESFADRSGGVHETMFRPDSGEMSVLHAGLFFCSVWIVSSLRIHRLRAFWRVGLGLKRMRGPSGDLLPRGPKARAVTGGSDGGAGASGCSDPGPVQGPRGAAHVPGDDHLPMPALDNFRS